MTARHDTSALFESAEAITDNEKKREEVDLQELSSRLEEAGLSVESCA